MWRERLASRIAARDAVERAPFERVFAAYAKLLRRSDFQSDAIERLRSEATLLRHGGGTGSTAATGGSSGADTSQLEARVRELQDELSAKYKTESAAAHAQLALQSEAKEWRRKYEEADAALAALRTVEAEAQRALVARERETAEAREARDAASAQMLTLHKSASELTVENERLARDLRDRRTQWTQELERLAGMQQELRALATAAAAGGGGGGGDDDGAADAAAHDFGGGAVVGSVRTPPTRLLLALDAHTSAAAEAQFNPSGSMLATAGSDSTIKIWDTVRGANVMTLRASSSGASSALVSASMSDALIAGAGVGGVVSVWQATTRRLRYSLTGHTGRVNVVRFTADGKTLVSAGKDRSAKLWDMGSGKRLRSLNGSSNCLSLSIGSDSRQMCTGHQDHAIRLWDIRTGQRQKVISVHESSVISLSFAPPAAGAPRLLSTSRDGCVHFLF